MAARQLRPPKAPWVFRLYADAFRHCRGLRAGAEPRGSREPLSPLGEALEEQEAEPAEEAALPAAAQHGHQLGSSPARLLRVGIALLTRMSHSWFFIIFFFSPCFACKKDLFYI